MTMPLNTEKEIVFLNYTDFFDSLRLDIDRAASRIDLEVYIFDNDKLGQEIAAMLMSAALRGVHVRILVDSAGTPAWGGHLTKQLESVGIETRIFHPFPWRLWQWSRAKVRVPSLLKAIYLLLKINARNHRKVILIDKKITYVGSANISQCHLSKEQGGDGWRDTIIRLDGLNIDELAAAFEDAWEYKPIPERLQELFQPIKTDPTFRLNNTRHRRRALYKDLLYRIGKCQKRVWITNAYFVPDNFLLKRLKERARAGVDVRILLPQKSDVFIMPWASTAFYESLVKAGVRIFEYKPSMLHAKTLILDDWFIVGSSNLNHRSLLHDLEVDVRVSSPEAKRLLEQQFLLDITHSQEINIKTLSKRSLLKRIIGRIVLYMKYWI